MTTPPDPDGDTFSVSVAGDVHGNLLIGTGNQVVNDADALLGPPATVLLAMPLWNVPTLPARVFVGRDEVIAELDALITSGSAAVTQAVYGMGGVGKTELVLHYAYRHRARYSLVWWITADAPDRIDAGLAGLTAQIAARVGKIPPVMTADAVSWAVGFLNAHSGWLLVLDNVEDRTHVERLLGQLSGGRVLITSRRDVDWEQLVDGCIRLDLLTPDAAAGLLVTRSRQEDPDTAWALAAELGWLPLALTQSAAYLIQTRMTMADYLDRLRAQPVAILGVAAAGSAQATVARVWDITLDAITAVSPLAIEMLQVLACLAPDNVPRAVVAALADDESAEVDTALGLLSSYSMVTLTATTVSTHRLVQAVAAEQARAVGAWAPVLSRALAALIAARPTGNPSSVPASWPFWAAFSPHVAALAQHFPPDTTDLDLAYLLGENAIYLRTQGAHTLAYVAAEAALAITEAALGSDHADVALRLTNVGGMLLQLGRMEEALPFQQRALAISQQIFDPNDPAIGEQMNDLASILRGLDRLDEALPLQRQALAISETALGPDHPTVGDHVNNLALNLRMLGRMEEALPLQRRALAITEAAYGPDHPHVAIRLNNLAMNLHCQGRSGEALPLQERALAIGEIVLGPDHPDVAVRLSNLAGILLALDRLPEAEQCARRAVAIVDVRLGRDHPTTDALYARLRQTEAALRR